MGLCFNMKNFIALALLILLAVSCGENGGDAPGGATESSCAGDVVGGACWYLGLDGESCDQTCAAHGGYNSATLSYAGSGGSLANCEEVADAIGMTIGTASDAGCFAGFGCIYDVGANDRRRCSTATTSAAATTGVIRACACNE